MKKILLIFLTVILLASLCFAGSVQDKCKAVIEKKNAVADPCASCDTGTDSAQESHDGTRDGSAAIAYCGEASYTTHQSQTIATSAALCITELQLWIRCLGSAAGTLTAQLWSDSGGHPNELVTGASGTWSIVPGAYAFVAFTFADAVNLAAGTYHILVWASAATTWGASDYCLWGMLNGTDYADGDHMTKACNGSDPTPTGGSWTADTGNDCMFQAMGCTQ